VRERDPLFLEVLVALGAGGIAFGPIHCDGWEVTGYAVTTGKHKGAVYVDPSHDVCDTVIHELIHRLRPKWSERKVRSQTRTFTRHLSDAERDRLYTLIQSVAKVKKRPLVVEVD
jgi:hypothetical protein